MKLRSKLHRFWGALLTVVIFITIISSNAYANETVKPLVISNNIVIATTTSSTLSPTASPSATSKDDEDEKYKEESRNWFQRVWDSIGDVKNAVGDIVSSIKKIFTEGLSFLIDITVGNILQGMYNTVAEGMSKWVYSTPKLIGFKWIKTLWTAFYILSLIEIIAALIFTAAGAILGKERKNGKPFNPMGILVALIVSLLGTYFSLFIADTIITFKNEAVNSLVSSTLYEQYQGYKDEPFINKNLTKDDMRFESFTGDALCRMAYGLKNDTANPGKPIYKAFIDSNGGFSGLINMTLAMVVLTVLGLLGMILNGVLGIIGAGSPFWWGWCVFTGDYDPAYGWINLFGRSVLVTAFFDAAWFAAVKINTTYKDEFASSGPVLTSLFFILAVLIACVFWFKWVAKAVMKPLTLAGAQAREWWGSKSESAGKYIENIGNHYGISQLSNKGSQMQAVGKEHQAIAKEKKEDNYDWNKGNVKDRLRNTKLEHERQYVRQEGAIKAGYIKAGEQQRGEHQGRLKQFSIAGMSNDKVYNLLNAKGFSGVVHKSEDGRLMIDEAYMRDAKKEVLKSFQDNYIDPNSVLNDDIGFKVQGIGGEQLSEIENVLNEEEIKYEKLYNLSVNQESLNKMERDAKSFEEFYNANTHNVKDCDYENGQAGYSFALSGQQSKTAETIFQDNNIRFNKKGNKIVVNASDFDLALDRLDKSASLVASLQRDENGGYSYNGMNIENYNSLKNALDNVSIDYKADENLWIDNHHKDAFLSSIGKVGENSIEYSSDIEYVSYSITNNRDYQNIKEELDRVLPREAIIHIGNEKQGYINIDKDNAETAKRVMENYWKRTPYWEGSDGYYYYKDGRSSKVVAHLSRPQDKGRYMGKK